MKDSNPSEPAGVGNQRPDDLPKASESIPSDAPVRVLIVDDHPLFREGVRQFLSRQEGFVCCGEAVDFDSAETVARDARPAVALLDVRLHDREGTELIPVLRRAVPGVRILMVSAYDDMVHVERALRAGADGYLTKEQSPTELVIALRTVMAGDLYLPRELSTVLLRQMLLQPPGVTPSGIGALSPREFEVFQLIGGGLSTREVAERLGISVKTVETHRENIKRKLQLGDAAHLVQAAHDYLNGATARNFPQRTRQNGDVAVESEPANRALDQSSPDRASSG